ncbi:hypothetical protein NP493_132g01000 [Ridgeia piscesae]|uniref:Uncharacterized protein n=1 Tax=Ridgeia piscesae TaxID=27915 RepID=A0AAD9P5A3_RIDPI|nr:hypothetical protein NP493_132g01000 [Ridgeia piscesae]
MDVTRTGLYACTPERLCRAVWFTSPPAINTVNKPPCLPSQPSVTYNHVSNVTSISVEKSPSSPHRTCHCELDTPSRRSPSVMLMTNTVCR